MWSDAVPFVPGGPEAGIPEYANHRPNVPVWDEPYVTPKDRPGHGTHEGINKMVTGHIPGGYAPPKHMIGGGVGCQI